MGRERARTSEQRGLQRARARHCPSLLPSWLATIIHPAWPIVSCYLVTSCHDLPVAACVSMVPVLPSPGYLAAALSRWPAATPGPRPTAPCLTASWSHKDCQCDRHHARLVMQLLASAPCGGTLSRQRGNWYNREYMQTAGSLSPLHSLISSHLSSVWEELETKHSKSIMTEGINKS